MEGILSYARVLFRCIIEGPCLWIHRCLTASIVIHFRLETYAFTNSFHRDCITASPPEWLHGLSDFLFLGFRLLIIFTVRLHAMQRTVLRGFFCPSVCLSVCPSVLLSNACICDKTKEISAHILTSYERTFILVFRHKEWLDDPLYLKF